MQSHSLKVYFLRIAMTSIVLISLVSCQFAKCRYKVENNCWSNIVSTDCREIRRIVDCGDDQSCKTEKQMCTMSRDDRVKLCVSTNLKVLCKEKLQTFHKLIYS